MAMALHPSNVKTTAGGSYDALGKLFEVHRDDVLEIEILPSAISPEEGQFYVQDGLNIGIPKKVLVSAFLRAREVFAGRDGAPSHFDLVRKPNRGVHFS
jgi:hypothetical protein